MHDLLAPRYGQLLTQLWSATQSGSELHLLLTAAKQGPGGAVGELLMAAVLMHIKHASSVAGSICVIQISVAQTDWQPPPSPQTHDAIAAV